jgi:hypothetical protein
MDTKLEFEVYVEGPADMMDDGEEGCSTEGGRVGEFVRKGDVRARGRTEGQREDIRGVRAVAQSLCQRVLSGLEKADKEERKREREEKGVLGRLHTRERGGKLDFC